MDNQSQGKSFTNSQKISLNTSLSKINNKPYLRFKHQLFYGTSNSKTKLQNHTASQNLFENSLQIISQTFSKTHQAFSFQIQPESSKGENAQKKKTLKLMQKFQQPKENAIKSLILYNNIKYEFYLTQRYIKDIIQEILVQLNMSKQDKAKIIGIKTLKQDITIDYILSLKNYLLPLNQLEKRCKDKYLYLVIVESQEKEENKLLNYQFKKFIGRGGFSEVFLVRNKQSNEYYALKLTLKAKVKQKNYQIGVKNQREIHQMLDHQNICKMIDYFQSQNFYGLVLEYCIGGQLFNQLKKVRRFKQNEAIFYFLEILKALQYIHSKGLIYRDIKPENILIRNNGHLALTDFGLAKKISQPNNQINTIVSRQNYSYSFCGSPQYMAPQMLQKKGHNQMLDYYCLGAFLYQLVYGAPPFYSLDVEQIYQAVLKEEVRFHPSIQVSDQFKDFIRQIMNKRPQERQQFIGNNGRIIEQHPLIKNYMKDNQRLPPFVPDFSHILQNIERCIDSEEAKIFQQYLQLYKLQLQKNNKQKQDRIQTQQRKSNEVLRVIMQNQGKNIREMQEKNRFRKKDKTMIIENQQINEKSTKDHCKKIFLSNRIYLVTYNDDNRQ